MAQWHVTIMSEDPDDEYGIEQGDNHQKYGLTIEADSESEAIEKGEANFKGEYEGLPIFWTKAFKL
jgi:hypothetical protein